uniref:Uncharacterized protein n=1 Tax=Rhizophora mucronata TaxID=61149 RepID=A0A2P2N1W9_RHIMU
MLHKSQLISHTPTAIPAIHSYLYLDKN